MKLRYNLCAFFVFVLAFSLQAPASAAEKQWRAGVAKVNISPELPIWLGGYAARTKPAEQKNDDLWAKALVLEDAEGHRAVLLTMDLVGIPRDFSLSVREPIEKRYNLPRAAIALNTSHTHSGPVIRGNLMAMYALDEEQSRRMNEYKTAVVPKLVAAVDEAFKTMQPAKLAWGIGKAGFAVNRRNNKPEGQIEQMIKDGKIVGPSDHELPVLAVYDENDKLRALVGGYACHGTVLSDYFVSADWPGAGQNELERRHPGAIAMFVAGCGGDQNPLPRRSVALMEKYGHEFADGVDAALKTSMQPMAPTLKVAYEEIDLPFDKLPTRADLVAQTEEQFLVGRWAKYMLKELDRDGSFSQTYPYPIQAWKLGDNLTWVLLGGEAVVDYSLRLKAELGPQVWISSYSNDVMAYIPSRRVLREGGYEGADARYPYGLPAPWAPSVEQKIVDETHRLVEQLTQ